MNNLRAGKRICIRPYTSADAAATALWRLSTSRLRTSRVWGTDGYIDVMFMSPDFARRGVTRTLMMFLEVELDAVQRSNVALM